MITENTVFIEEYEINPYTLAILPYYENGELYSKIIEVDQEFICPMKPTDIVKRACELFGSDYDGRRGATRSMTGYTHKAPIEIEKMFSIFFFPTTSPERDECIWIAAMHVEKYAKIGSTEVMATFTNKKQLNIPVSHGTFETQVARSAILKTKLDQKIAETRRRYKMKDDKDNFL